MTDQMVLWVVVAVAAIIVIGAAVWLARARRRRLLESHYGDEYRRLVAEKGHRSSAEAELAEREKRVEQLPLRPLSASERERFAERWRMLQARFVDEPETAITDVDRLIGEVMSARGYELGDFETQAAEISVRHPEAVESYRTAHSIALRAKDTTTEELRRAMLRYRDLYDGLVADEGGRRATQEQKERRDDAQRRERP